MPSALENKLKNLVSIPKRLPNQPMVPPSLLAKFLSRPYSKAILKPAVGSTHLESAHYGGSDIPKHERGKLRAPREEEEPAIEPTGAQQRAQSQDVFTGRGEDPSQIGFQNTEGGHGGKRERSFADLDEEARAAKLEGKEKPTTERGATVRGHGRQATGTRYRETEGGKQWKENEKPYRQYKAARQKEWKAAKTPQSFEQWLAETYPDEIQIDKNGNQRIQGQAKWVASQNPEAAEKAEAANPNKKDEIRAAITDLASQSTDIDKAWKRWRAGEKMEPEDKQSLKDWLISLLHWKTQKPEEKISKWLDTERKPKADAIASELQPGQAEEPGKPTERSKLGEIGSPHAQPPLPGMQIPPTYPPRGNWTEREFREPRRIKEPNPNYDPKFGDDPELNPKHVFPNVPDTGGVVPTARRMASPEELQEIREAQGHTGEPLPEHRGAKEGWEVRVPETYTRRVYDENGKEQKPIVEKGWDTQYIPFGENEPDTDYSQAVEDDLHYVLQGAGMQNYVEEAPRYTATQNKDGSLKNLTKTVVLKPAKAFREAEFREGGGEPASPEQLRRILYGFGGPDYPIELLPNILSVNVGQERTKRTVQAVTEPRISIKIPLDQEEFQDRINGALEWFETGRARDWEDTEKYAYYLMKTNPETTPDSALRQVEDIQQAYKTSGAASRYRKRTGEKRPSSGDRAANQSLKKEQAGKQRQHEENQRKDRVKRQKEAAKKAEEQAKADDKRVQERQAEIEDQQIRDEQERLRRSRLQGGTGPR